jgi:hypothetical protein
MQLNGRKVKDHAYLMKNKIQLNRSGGGEGWATSPYFGRSPEGGVQNQIAPIRNDSGHFNLL